MSRWGTKAMMIAAAVVLPLVGASASPRLSASPAISNHADEVVAYVGLLAIAQTASDRCADVFINTAEMKDAPRFFHITPSDDAAVQFELTLELQRLFYVVRAAPSTRDWCDGILASYGPDGTMLPGLMMRDPDRSREENR